MMVIPVFATIIPLYSYYAQYQLLDNIFWLSVVYVSVFLPISTWMLMNLFDAIPLEIEDTASIDGCSKLETRIINIKKGACPFRTRHVLHNIVMKEGRCI